MNVRTIWAFLLAIFVNNAGIAAGGGLLSHPHVSLPGSWAQEVRACQDVYTAAQKNQWKEAWDKVEKKRARCQLLSDVVFWRTALKEDIPHTFANYQDFLSRRSSWPKRKFLESQAEKVLPDMLSTPAALQWFQKAPAKTLDGKLAHIRALRAAGKKDEATRLIRQVWVAETFSEKEEKKFLALYETELLSADHLQRVDRLLWGDAPEEAGRLLSRLPAPERAWAQARIALLSSNPKAAHLISQVPASLKEEPGLLFDQLKKLRRSESPQAAAFIQALDRKKTFQKKGFFKSLQEEKKWWNERNIIARDALTLRGPQLAYAIMSGYHQKMRYEQSESEWFLGWISLRFLKNPKKALEHFQKMAMVVQSPLSKSQAAYWVARAYEAQGDSRQGRVWYAKAQAHPTGFYGLKAREALKIKTPLPFKAELPVDRRDQEIYDRKDYVRVARLLSHLKQHQLAESFLVNLFASASSMAEKAVIFKLAREIGPPSTGVVLCEMAESTEPLLLRASYPQIALKKGESTVEGALLNALIRKESKFSIDAESHAGALGLMQLRPFTAQLMAVKRNLPFSKERLTSDPLYNVTLGATYFAERLEVVKGSYVAALASYNAGPVPYKKWQERNGDPQGSEEEIIDWIERVSYPETRFYIQKVLANLKIYQHLGNES